MQQALYLFIIFGILLIASSITYSLYLPIQLIAISIASIGSIVGTTIICISMQKIISIKSATSQEQFFELGAENAELQRKLEKETDERARIAFKCHELDEEVNRYKRMQIDISKISAALKLVTLQYEGKMTDFTKMPLGKNEGWLTNKEHEYIGVYQIDFKTLIGVDLQKVRLKKDGNTIFAFNVKPEFMGFEKYMDTPILNEVRTFNEGFFGGKSAEIVINDERVHQLAEKQRLGVKQRLELGNDHKGLGEAAKKLGEEFLLRILAPLECNIQFLDSDSFTDQTLAGFLEDHNRLIESKVVELQGAKRVLLNPVGA
jgi:hypothetical protein